MAVLELTNQVSINIEGAKSDGRFLIRASTQVMPSISLVAESSEDTNIEKIEYSFVIRCKTAQLDISSPQIKGICTNGGELDFGGVFMGGILVGKARALVRRDSGASYWSDVRTIRAKIVGENPSLPQIKAYSACRQSMVIAYIKSSCKMFDPSGYPYFDGGFGLAQLKAPSVQQLWSWRENMSGCAVQWLAKREQAIQRPARLRQSNFLKFKSLPDFTDEQIELEAYAGFVNEQYYYPKARGLLKNQREWVPSKDKGEFADSCKEVERQIFRDEVSTP